MAQLMKVEEADKLYERYGKPLEKDYHGEYAAITKVTFDHGSQVVVEP